MAKERTPTWEDRKVILPPAGAPATGKLPAAAAGPTRPVAKRTLQGTNARQIPRPAQGNNGEGQDLSI